MAQRLGGRSSQVGVFGALPHGTREELRGEHTGIQTEITHFMASLSTRELKPLNVEDFLSRVRPCSETGSDQHRATYLHSHDPRREGQNPEVRAGQTKTEVVPRNFPRERMALKICKDDEAFANFSSRFLRHVSCRTFPSVNLLICPLFVAARSIIRPAVSFLFDQRACMHKQK